MNLAPGGTATQSSSYRNTTFEFMAEWAINGNTDARYDQLSCSHTNEENEPWWKVTFKYDILVNEILLVNRGDSCGKYLV